FVIYGKPPAPPPNGSQAGARDLGTVVHLIQPTLTITSVNTDAWYRLEVPKEAFSRAGDQVLDVSGGFAVQEGAGLGMEVVDAAGNILSSGERVRIVARQGDTLYVHVFGKNSAGDAADQNHGSGAYTLVIDTLPQVAAVEAHSLLPG